MRGTHDATATFDIGNPDIGLETAKTIELELRRATIPFRFEATAYYTSFNGFIYRRLTGNTCEDVARVGSADPAFPLELNQAIYSQRDATFRGGEFQSQLDVGPLHGGIWGIENQSSLCARPSATAPMFHGFRRCASAAACSGAMPTG